MNYMAERGFDAVCFDIRGYGTSTRPKELDEPAAKNKPVVRASVVIRDIGAAGSSAARVARRRTARVHGPIS